MVGEFELYLYHNNLDQKEHLAIVGDVREKQDVLVRIECFTAMWPVVRLR
jgi:GTP cyclohydrolase II